MRAPATVGRSPRVPTPRSPAGNRRDQRSLVRGAARSEMARSFVARRGACYTSAERPPRSCRFLASANVSVGKRAGSVRGSIVLKATNGTRLLAKEQANVHSYFPFAEDLPADRYCE